MDNAPPPDDGPATISKSLVPTARAQQLSTEVTLRRRGKDPVAAFLADLGEGSRRTLARALDTIAGVLAGGGPGQAKTPGARASVFPWESIRRAQADAVRNYLATHYASATAKKMLSALRGVLKKCRDLDLMSNDDFMKAASIKAIRRTEKPAGRAIGAAEVARLLAICPDTPIGLRDVVMLSLAVVLGLRRAEIVRLDVTWFDQEAGELRVFGKRGKWRVLHPPPGVAQRLAQWLRVRRGEQGDPLVVRVLNGVVTNDRLTTQTVYARFKVLEKRAGLSNAFSPHDLRRTCLTNLLNADVDLLTVQRIAGHESVSTTGRYDRRGEQAKKSALMLVDLPPKG